MEAFEATERGMYLNLTDDPNKCPSDALTDKYGWFSQSLLASLAFTFLILKRFCEPQRHRRSWQVWFYDTSKQALGAAIVHFSNISFAENVQGDPCTWYLISFLLDSTVGLLIIWAGICACIYIGKKKGFTTILFGHYGHPPSTQAWTHQCILYIIIMIIEKLLIIGLMGFDFWMAVCDWILKPIYDPHMRVFISVLLVPFFINALIFWVTDNFLMLKVKEEDLPRTSNGAAYLPRGSHHLSGAYCDDESSHLLPSSEHTLEAREDLKGKLLIGHLSVVT